MHQRSKKIRSIFNGWFKHDRAENFQAYKQMKIESILDKLSPKNFDTPEKAFRLLHLMYAEKLAYQDLEVQKELADELDKKN